MAVYRMTEFTSPTPEKVSEACQNITEVVANAGAEMIDVVMMDGGKGIVLARYATEAAMNTAMQYNKEAFGALIAAGVVDGASIESRAGDKVFSF
jgi:enamine deaminase RidA (YjgF/YER057c/UK114 family)